MCVSCGGDWCELSLRYHGKMLFLWRKRRKMTPLLPPVCIMVMMLHLWVGVSLCGIPKWASWELDGPWRLLPPFRGEHLNGWAQTSQHAPISNFPQGQALRVPRGWIKKSSSRGYTTMIDWVVGYNGNQVLGRSRIRWRKVVYSVIDCAGYQETGVVCWCRKLRTTIVCTGMRSFTAPTSGRRCCRTLHPILHCRVPRLCDVQIVNMEKLSFSRLHSLSLGSSNSFTRRHDLFYFLIHTCGGVQHTW